jgi:uncharacterized membrane protein (UPF0127 family)
MLSLKIKPKYILIALSFLAVIIFIIWLALLNPNIKEPVLHIGSINIPVEIAKTEAAREKGLSSRPSLDKNKGMLFIFSKSDFHQFWMRDMNFPIDIIWINDGKVVGITPNVSNDFDSVGPQVYSPPQPAQYVLEVNAGFSAEKNIEIGDFVTFGDI